MMLNFCTLFDSNYLAKGITMYESLNNVCFDFHLYIFAFDDISFNVLKKIDFKNATVISLKEFEDEKLLNVKNNRTKAEYSWTSTPSTILYCLNNFDIDSCTYVDADLYFFNNPVVLIDEMGKADVLITDHRYTTQYDQSKESGRYCVQFMCFKKTLNGLTVLNWWRSACLDWCYNRKEDGKFGDQKYLDNWNENFKGVHDLKHLGGGVAPWNVQQYFFYTKNDLIKGLEITSDKEFDLIFYHFHHLNNQKINFMNEFYLGPYLLTKNVISYIYKPYILKLKTIDKFIKSLDFTLDTLGSVEINFSNLRLIAHIIKNSFKRNKIIWFK